MKSLTLRKVDVVAYGKFTAVTMAIFGLLGGLLGLIMLIIGLVTPQSSSGSSTPVNVLGVVLNFLAVLLIPFLYTIFGFAMGYLGASFMNLVLKVSKGLTILVDEGFVDTTATPLKPKI